MLPLSLGKKLFPILMCLPLFAVEREVLLWPGGAPGSEGISTPEKIEPPAKDHDYTRVSSIHRPSLTVMTPPAGTANGAAMIIAPGGGHRFLSFDIEGTNVAKYLNSIGVTAFILKYRLAREEGSKYKVEVEALADAKRAIRLVRAQAASFGVDPGRIGIMGFSAGGELAVLASTRYDEGSPKSEDVIEKQSSRPDYQVLIYPGGNGSAWPVAKGNPPAFLLCAANDKGPATNLSLLYPAMMQAGIPVEIHVYDTGGHGFGIREHPSKPTVIATTWFLRVGDWMKSRGYLANR